MYVAHLYGHWMMNISGRNSTMAGWFLNDIHKLQLLIEGVNLKLLHATHQDFWMYTILWNSHLSFYYLLCWDSRSRAIFTFGNLEHMKGIAIYPHDESPEWKSWIRGIGRHFHSKNLARWWFFPTHLKNMRKSNWIMKPQGSGWKFQKSLSCHHPAG